MFVKGLLLVVAAGMAVSGCAGSMSERASPAPLAAGATLKNKEGVQVGVATLIQMPEGVRISVTGYRLPPGRKGIHIHAVGQCQPPAFDSAGPHFNPMGKRHGHKNPEGPHAGDLPNMEVSAAGEGGIDYVDPLVTLRAGQPGSLVGGNGTSLVIHAGPDDEVTDPSGNSGARIACGVIAVE